VLIQVGPSQVPKHHHANTKEKGNADTPRYSLGSKMTRTSTTSRNISTVVCLCCYVRGDIYCRVWDHFVRQTAGKSILPLILYCNGGAMHPRLSCFRAWPILTPNLLLFVSGARWQASQREPPQLFRIHATGTANSAAEADSSSEMACYRCNP
jgi:hypothetical protein